MAFLQIFWQAGTLWRADLTEVPVTVNFPSGGIRFSQAMALVCWNSSSKVFAVNSAILRRTRSAVRSHRLLRTMPRSSPM